MRLYHASLLPELLGPRLVPTSFMNRSEEDVGVWFYESREDALRWLNPLNCGVVYSVAQEDHHDWQRGIPGEWMSPSPVQGAALRVEYRQRGPEVPHLRSYLTQYTQYA